MVQVGAAPVRCLVGTTSSWAVLDVQLPVHCDFPLQLEDAVGHVWGTVSPDGSVSHITGGNFATSAITINGWLRDFLWAQASQVIGSYGSALSAYGLMFLGAHFVWAFSLMFLFSGRGYWQELIESIVWAHNKLKVAPAIQPRALSITQGRAVGWLTICWEGLPRPGPSSWRELLRWDRIFGSGDL
jgi:hypothetical protein